MYTALFLLNESLSWLSRDRFDINEWGQLETAAQSDVRSADDDLVSGETSYLASKYQSLWEQIPQQFLNEKNGGV